jgi:hypothetical protein
VLTWRRQAVLIRLSCCRCISASPHTQTTHVQPSPNHNCTSTSQEIICNLMEEQTIADVASWLERPHTSRPSKPDKDALRKILGGRVDSHSRPREIEGCIRRHIEDARPQIKVSNLHGPLSRDTDAHPTPISKSALPRIRPIPSSNSVCRDKQERAWLSQVPDLREINNEPSQWGRDYKVISIGSP